jgi:hypothetical protein
MSSSPPKNDLAELESAMQIALTDCLGGLSAGPMLYKRLRRVAEARLQTRLGHGSLKNVDRAQIRISEGPAEGTITVELRLHRGANVRHVKLSTQLY